MPRDQLALFSQSSSAPGVTPIPCHTSGVRPESGSQPRSGASAEAPIGTMSDVPSSKATTSLAKVNMGYASQQHNMERPRTSRLRLPDPGMVIHHKASNLYQFLYHFALASETPRPGS